jgi:hypothetical protein
MQRGIFKSRSYLTSGAGLPQNGISPAAEAVPHKQRADSRSKQKPVETGSYCLCKGLESRSQGFCTTARSFMGGST